VKQSRDFTGPWERWRAAGKGRTEGLGGAMGLLCGSLSEIPFSTIPPIKREASSSLSCSAPAPKIFGREEELFESPPLPLCFFFSSMSERATRERERERERERKRECKGGRRAGLFVAAKGVYCSTSF
jgi:hypothetical protein